MKYIIGFDGGGTKSVCMLADETGTILAKAVSGCSNHQICGIKNAVHTISSLVKSVINQAGLDYSQISCLVMGLAGADIDSDIRLISNNLQPEFDKIPYSIVNDIWLPFSIAAPDGWGAISICGTGSNFAVKLPNGNEIGVRALSYILGSRGGGLELSDSALHCAFRSNEHTGEQTRLESELPSFCGKPDINDLALEIYLNNDTYHHKFNIPSLVMQLADEGDEVCRRLLTEQGSVLGEMLGYLTVHSGIDRLNVPVVLGGSLYTVRNQYLMNSFHKEYSRYVPDYQINLLDCEPVAGAILIAMEQAGIHVDNNTNLYLHKQTQVYI